MFTGWAELFRRLLTGKSGEFVSVDARYDSKNDHSSYEMLSKDESGVVTSLPPVHLTPASPTSGGGHRRTDTPDYFGQTARYQPPPRSFSSPRPPGWDPATTYARPVDDGRYYEEQMQGRLSPPGRRVHEDYSLNPLGMNRI
jgi:hypothetical protein